MTETDPTPTSDISPVEVHKPKPARNWRDFLKEYAVIVIGVLTALAAQQAVEWWHWRNQVAQARVAIANELTVSIGISAVRVRTQHCTEQRLDALAVIVDAASRTGLLPPVPEFSRPSTSAWPDETWQSIIASQTATHFSDTELSLLGGAYAQIQRQGIRTRDEMMAWSRLYTMVGPGRRLDPSSEAVLRVALSEARYYNRITAIASGQIIRQINGLDLPFSTASRARIDDSLHGPIANIYTCQPMETWIPPTYGQAPSRSYFYTVRDWQKYPPYVRKAPSPDRHGPQR